MNNQKRIFFKNILWATVLILLIGMMSCASFQERNSRQEVCYIADFSDLHVKIYPQASVSKEGICYHDFLLKLNDTSFQKSWLWRAGDTQEEIIPPAINYADINNDGKKELIFVFINGIDRGSGVHLEDVYVLDIFGTEYPVENPLDYLQEHGAITLRRMKTGVVVAVSIEQKSDMLFYPNDFFPDLEHLGSNIGFSSDWMQYYVEGNQLCVEVPFLIYAGMTIGSIHLQYTETNGIYGITDGWVEQLPKEKV